jgi:enoyl-CoA hydratase
VSGESEPDVVFSRRGRVAEIVLNRPRAINALTHEMVLEIRRALAEWAGDDDVQTVLLTGRGERGLCAGGDIVALYRDLLGGGGMASAEFWRDEYELNGYIGRYPKPFVALMDGITLGGGVGLAGHASLRVVTERSKVGMPETAIGFTPDVGGSWLLSHAPGELGTYLGLTARPVGAADALLTGFADHFVPSDRLGALVDDLETTDASAAVARHAQPAPGGELAAAREWIDAAFSAPTAVEIVARLRADPSNEGAVSAAGTIAANSPTAVALTLAALRRAALLPDLDAALEQELKVSVRCLASPDLAEGIRARVIDKDGRPRWRPASLDEVDPASIEAFFA